MKKIISCLIGLLVLLIFTGCTNSNETGSDNNSDDTYYSYVTESDDMVMINNFSSSGNDIEWLGVVYGYDFPSDGLFISLYSNSPEMYVVDLENGESAIENKSYEVGDILNGSVVKDCVEHDGIFMRDAIKGTATDGKHYHDGELFNGVCENTHLYYENGEKIDRYYKSNYDNIVIDSQNYFYNEEENSQLYTLYEGDVYKYEVDSCTMYSTSPNEIFYAYEITNDDDTYTILDQTRFEVGQNHYSDGVITNDLGQVTNPVKVQ